MHHSAMFVRGVGFAGGRGAVTGACRSRSLHARLVLLVGLIISALSIVLAPASPAAASNWSQVAAGEIHTCGLRDGVVYCWGNNKVSQLGGGDKTDSTQVVKVVSTSEFTNSNVTQISAGARHTCALRGGVAFCWGFSYYGYFGDGTTNNQSARPVKVGSTSAFANSNLTQISAGNSHTCAVREGVVFCWGYNVSGQLGDGTKTDRTRPVKVSSTSAFTNSNVTQIST
jgi:alpha-tubulin suppressor-like RCC1 family protein